ncbi:MAG: aminotransferase class III-fold pyridoxal phosphate-dependent enzyme [Desulfovibrio sp.]|nr:aminotransferase class III-fold pyridoxal phosphate-dependent enzyme [Desulfovibrio sp.]MBI4960301.1 aminotransferase class III-fold pyridoxal phosphate-dependent enzyme [Desulfovibrio sp.]
MNKSETVSPEAYAQSDLTHVWHHLVQHQAFAAKGPMIVVEGDGLRLKDINGKEYLDATSGGVWCVNVGYGRDRIADAVCAQMKKMPYYAATAGNIPFIELAEEVTSHMPGLTRIYLSNSGSEANEKAYKIVRALAHITGNTTKKKVLYRNRDYHGTTIAALSSCGQPERREWFGPFVPGFVEFPHACCYRCAFGKTYPGCDIDCAKSVERIIQEEGPETIGGLIVEPITAGGGVIPPVSEYYDVLAEICRRHGVLIIMDEVVCGMGRTGTMFGYQQYGVTPDIVTMAKGVASAYMPISITATTEDIFKAFLHDPADKLAYFRDISTYGGCAAACTAALENMKIIEEENLLSNVTAMGAYLLDGLRGLLTHPNVGDVRGKGLLCGVEFVEDKKSKKPLPESKVIQIVGEAAAQGVLLGRTNRSFPGLNNIINMAPAYVVTKADIDAIVSTLRQAIAKILG